jgi:hypothetical protein
METLLVAALLIIVGIVATLNGYQMFRILLPIMGFLVGYGIGFSGLQAFLGAGVASTTVAILTGVLMGLLLTAISYFYFTLAVVVFGASLVASIFTFLGQAIGLRENGFIVLMLGIAGAIIGAGIVLRHGLQNSLVMYVSAGLGTGLILIGVLLGVGDLSMAELNRTGILTTIGSTVDQSFVWLLVWVGGTIIGANSQRSIMNSNLVPYDLSIQNAKVTK